MRSGNFAHDDNTCVTPLYCMVQHCTVHCCTALYSALLYSTVQCSVQHCTVQCTALYSWICSTLQHRPGPATVLYCTGQKEYNISFIFGLGQKFSQLLHRQVGGGLAGVRYSVQLLYSTLLHTVHRTLCSTLPYSVLARGGKADLYMLLLRVQRP